MSDMMPKNVYILDDFTGHADRNFPDDYAAFKTLSGLHFSTKTYIDENQAARQVVMLFVGHYWLKRGGPSAWACATGTTVHYFYGNPSETVCKPVPQHYRRRIYFDPPFSTAAATQHTTSGTAGYHETHTAGLNISEAVINYLFLEAGHLEQVQNREKIDMLANFEYACAAIANRVAATNGLKQPEFVWKETTKESISLPISDNKRKRSVEQPRIKKETDVIDDLGTHHPHKEKSTQIPLSVQLREYEATMEAKLAEEKRARSSEVEYLQAQLCQRELELETAGSKFRRETELRQTFEMKTHEQEQQIKDLEDEAEGLYDAVQELKDKNRRDRLVSESWAMKVQSLKWLEQQVRVLRHKERSRKIG